MEACDERSGSWRPLDYSPHLRIWRKQRNEQKKKKEKKKAPKYEHRGQVVFTYLYFSHARIRAARICLINTFPAGLSLADIQISVRAESKGGGNNVEIFSTLLEYRKIVFPSPTWAHFSADYTESETQVTRGGEQNRPLTNSRFLFTNATERD